MDNKHRKIYRRISGRKIFRAISSINELLDFF